MNNDAERHFGRRISERKEKNAKGDDNPTGSSTRGGLSIGDVPENIMDVAGSQMNQIQISPNNSRVDTIQQLGGSRQVVAMSKSY